MVGGRIHRPPYRGVLGLLEWARGVWFYLDGECLRNGVDLEKEAKRISARRLLNIIQSYWLDEQTKYVIPEYDKGSLREDTREKMDQFLTRVDETKPISMGYIEPTEEGFYPGLEEAGRLDV